jgi:hypothetical protein
MGGYGSGRWGTRKPDRKRIVENCQTLDVNHLVREGVVGPNAEHRGAWEWRSEPDDAKPSATIVFEVRTGKDGGVLRLRYLVTIMSIRSNWKAVESVSVAVRLATTNVPRNGLRWWLVCPAQRKDRSEPCHRRVGKLYLPAGERVFACRHCYDLTYQSCRESHRHQSMWNWLGASIGVSGKMAKRILDDKVNPEPRAQQRMRQRAVFTDSRTATDVSSTRMDSVN